MYILFNSDNKILGYHENYDVVDEYRLNLLYQHDIQSYIKFVKDKKAFKKFKSSLTDMELTAYRQTYIPYKYIDYLQCASHDINDLEFCKNILLSLYSNEELSKREEKNLKKTIYLLDDIIADNNTYTPSIEELERMKNHYDEMYTSYNFYDG